MSESDLNRLDSRWRYMLRFYYADDVKPPKKAGDLAIETVHTSRSSMEMERDVGKRRADIGEVVLLKRDPTD